MSPLRQHLRRVLLRLFVHTVGRLSDGIRICLDYGLTSGKMLDYVYRNQPTGRTFIGRWLDRRFLAAEGWASVRERRYNLEKLLCEAVAALRDEGRPVALLDVASGPGRYVFSLAEQVGTAGFTAICRDFDARWVADGAAEAKRRGLDMIRFETGDAFNRDSLLAVFPRPSLIVASGFYDWITDDERVRGSMRLLHEVLEPGGYLVVTNQSKITTDAAAATLFTDFNHRPLHMKARPAEQIEEWLREAGFGVQSTLSDSIGRFSVTRARKTA